MIRILSIDGGGVRGIIPSIVLAEIEKRAGQPISQMFDLVAGSSTGGLIALGLTVPDSDGQPAISAADLVKVYEHDAPRIFSRTNWQKVNPVSDLRRNKYADEVLNEVLGGYFGDAPISAALTDVLITSYEIQRREPWFFRSSKAREIYACEFSFKDVARATVAAPTFFTPAAITQEDLGLFHAFIDGSVVANNPTMSAYIEARRTYPDEEDFLIVSLGTGDYSRPLLYENVKDWGMLGWGQPIVNVLFHAMSVTVDYQMKRLLSPTSDGHLPYYRFQIKLENASDNFDDVSPENIEKLKAVAYRLIEEYDAALDAVVSQLTQQPDAAPAGIRDRISSIWRGMRTKVKINDG